MQSLLHPELTYIVRGVLFDVRQQLTMTLPESYFQEAVAIGLEEAGIPCQSEKEFEVRYRGVPVGRYRVDLWVDNGRLLLELKVAPELLPLHQAQAISYLKVTDADLALLVNFGEMPLGIQTLPNLLRQKRPQFQWHPRSFADDPEMLYPELVGRLLSALYRVHFELGPGFLHQVYRRATMVELRKQEISFRYLKTLPVYYHAHYLGDQPVRLIVVEDVILLATVAVKEVDDLMRYQFRARMREQQTKLGIIANFHYEKLDVIFQKELGED
ncbi:MAG: GxxExxY protein [Anaerolineae bacterium]|nr:GxxExxY protein [Anaerolineae bacterium]